MNAFLVANKSKTFAATIFAKNAIEACNIAWQLGAHHSSSLKPKLINGHGCKFSIVN